MAPNTVSAVLCLAALIIAWPVLAKDKPPKGGRGHKTEARNAEENRSEKTQPRTGKDGGFSAKEVEIIQGYVERYGALPGKQERRLPPGLARKVARGGKLPPGWEKKCMPGETLPPEVYQECRPLPPELVVKLPSPPDLTVTVAVEGKIVRLLEATREILDVFDIHVRL